MSKKIAAKPLSLTINGEAMDLMVRPEETLLEVLRDRLDMTGAKEGCGEGACGACTVIMDHEPRRACLTLALEAQGSEVLTVEGLGGAETLSPEQDAFIQTGAVQCGFCTPGMLMATHDLLAREESPDEKTIRRQISGHICRCTGYAKIVEAVELAAQRKSGEESS